MELRSVMPNSVTKPTSEPSEIQPPVNIAAMTPPISAKGKLAKVSSKLRNLPKAIYNMRKIPTPANSECTIKSSRDLALASASPV